MQKRRRFKQTSTLRERLLADTEHLREQAGMLPQGQIRDHVMRRIRQNEAAADLCEMLDAPRLAYPA